MKKLATGNGKIYCELSTVEFSGLARQVHSNVPDGTDISLLWVKQLSDLVAGKKDELALIATKSAQLAQSINAVI